MPLPLPNLDDRTFADLLDEALARVPTHDPDWTDHNVSDPGVTLVELFAWLSEMLIYRANQLPDRHIVTFLRLLNGPGWQPSADLSEDIRAAVISLRRRERAVTADDFELLAREASPEVARAKCVPRRYLGAGTEAKRKATQAGYISTIILPRSGAQPSAALVRQVVAYIEPRRILTTRHHVVGPFYAPVRPEIVLARRPDATENDVRRDVVGRLRVFLDPLVGGTDGRGWPFGRDVYVSELYQLLETIPGVDYVSDIALSSECSPDAVSCVAAPLQWHDDGDLIGLELAAHHLPQQDVDPEAIAIGAALLPVHVTVEARRDAAFDDAALRRAVKAAVRLLFHPLHGGPDGHAAKTVSVATIRTRVRARAEVDDVERVELGSAAGRLQRDEQGQVTAVRVEPGELVDLRVTAIAL